MSDGVTRHLVIGLGEIGRPILKHIETWYDRTMGIEVVGRDVDPFEAEQMIHVVHVCFPWSECFPDAVLEYVEQYKPDLCIIHSTVPPGTTRAIADQAQGPMVAYSPVRGRHGEMVKDLLRYHKFVGAPNGMSLAVAAGTLTACGFDVKAMEPPEALELAKLLATSYSGLLIAWAQEMERFAHEVGCSYWDVLPFLAEPPHLPKVAFQPGHIGGHCIMPNIELLNQVKTSHFLNAIRLSNGLMPEGDGERLRPIEMDKLLNGEEAGCQCACC